MRPYVAMSYHRHVHTRLTRQYRHTNHRALASIQPCIRPDGRTLTLETRAEEWHRHAVAIRTDLRPNKLMIAATAKTRRGYGRITETNSPYKRGKLGSRSARLQLAQAGLSGQPKLQTVFTDSLFKSWCYFFADSIEKFTPRSVKKRSVIDLD